MNRTVYQGDLFAGDILISDLPAKRFDPLTPMREPNLVKVLQQQTATRVGLLPHSILAQGGAAPPPATPPSCRPRGSAMPSPTRWTRRIRKSRPRRAWIGR